MNCRLPLLQTAFSIALLAAVPPAPLSAATYTWTDVTGGAKNWNDTANPNVWGQNAVFPNAVDDMANVTANTTTATTISLNTAITIGTLNIGDSTGNNGAYTIAAGTGGSLIFDVLAGNAVITQSSTSAGDTISAPISLLDNIVITNNGGTGTTPRHLTISGGVSAGVGATGSQVTKSGTGTVILSGTNTYTGSTVVTAGALRVTTAASLASSNLNLAGGVLELAHATNFTRALGTGDNQVQLTATNSGFAAFNGQRTVNIGGNVTPDTLAWASTNFIGNGQSLQFGSGSSDNTVIFSNAIDLALGTSTAATRTINVVGGINTTTDVRLANVISNSTANTGTLIYAGGGHAEITAANTYTAATQINGNTTLRITNLQNGGTASSLGASSNATANLVINGGFIEYQGTTAGSTDRNFNLGTSSGGFSNTATTANIVTWSGAAVMTGSGARTFTLTGNNTGNNTFSGGGLADIGGTTTLDKTGSGTWVIGGTNTNSAVRIREGTLAATGGSAISNTGTVNVTGNNGNNATFRLDSSETIGQLTGNGIVNVQANTLTITANTDTVYNGSFSSTAAGKIVKSGTGTIELGGTSTGLANTEFQAGTVVLRNPTALGAAGSNARMGAGTTIKFDNQGFLSLRSNTAALSLTTGAPAIGTAGTIVSLRADQSFTTDAVQFGDNTTWIYSSTMVDASAAGSWTFAEHHDDAVRLYLNGNAVLNQSSAGTFNQFTAVSDTVVNVNGTNSANTTIDTDVAVGANIQFRLQNGSGGVGPVNQAGINWTGSGFGIGYATTNLGSGGTIAGTQTLYTGFAETASNADTTRWKAYTNAVIANDFELAGAVTFDTSGMNGDRVIVNGVIKNGSGIGETGSLIKAGSNTLVLTNSNTYIGSTLINAGTVVAANLTGSATGSGMVQVEATAILAGNGRIATAAGNNINLAIGSFLKVGDPGTDISADTLTFALGTGAQFLSTGTIQLQIGTDGVGSPNTSADKLVVNGNSALSGILDVSTFIGAQTFALGDSWDLFDWNGSVTGAFSSIVLPSLSAYPSLTWNTSDLYSGGTISLTAVPEPARGILFLGALVILALCRRRK